MKCLKYLFLGTFSLFVVFSFSSDASAAGINTYRIAASPLNTSPKDIVIKNNYAFVIEGNSFDTTGAYFEVFDIANPSSPVKVNLTKNLSFSGGTWGVFWGSAAISGDYLYVVWTNGVRSLLGIYNISDPVNPVLSGELPITAGYAYSISLYQSYAYITGGGGADVIDISNPDAPAYVKKIPGISKSIISGNYLYAVPGAGNSLNIYSLSSDPLNPVLTGAAPIASFLTGISIVGNLAYVGTSATGDEFEIFDITNKAAPVKLGGHDFATNLNLHSLAVEGAYVYAPYDNGVYNIFDISDPAAPTIVGTGPMSGYGIRALVYGEYVVIASGWGGGGGGGYLNIYSTPPATIPNVISPTATSIVGTTATLGANVTSDGGTPLTEVGTCWGTTPTPVTNCFPQGGLTTGVFEHSRTGLQAGATIYYRGYAKNSVGTGYSSDGTFTTASSPDIVAENLNITGSLTTGSMLTFSADTKNIGTRGMDTSNSYKFKQISTANTGNTYDFAISGNYVYIVPFASPGVLNIYEISNKNNIIKISDINLPQGYAMDIEVIDNYIYIGTRSGYVMIYNISTPTNPVLENSYRIPYSGGQSALVVVGDYMYIGKENGHSFSIFNISNRNNPVPVWSASYSGTISNIAIQGSYAYVSYIDVYGGTGSHIYIYDITNPASPVLKSSLSVPNLPGVASLHALQVFGTYLYAGLWGAGNDFLVINVSDPENPYVMSGVDFGMVNSVNSLGAAVSVNFPYAYVSNNNGIRGINVIDVSNPSNLLQIGFTSSSYASYSTSFNQQYVFAAGGSGFGIFEPRIFSRFCLFDGVYSDINRDACAGSGAVRRIGGKDFDAGSLAVNEIYATSTVWTATAAGTYTAYFCTDVKDTNDFDGVSELDETNNCTTQTFVVTSPPLPPTVSIKYEPSNIFSGGMSTPSYSSTNTTSCDLYVSVDNNTLWEPGNRIWANAPTSHNWGTTQFLTSEYRGVRCSSLIGNNGSLWTLQNSAAPLVWNDIVYGNGLFVAVAYSGTGNRVMTSPDGITWTSRVTPKDSGWRSVTYGNGLFVAVAYTSTGANDRVMTSPDGINWTLQTSAPNRNWNGVTYGNGLFVAVAGWFSVDNVMTSPDGITWTSRTGAAANGWEDVTYANGLFVAVADSGTGNRVMTSPDGINWTSRASAADNSWGAVEYGNGLFVAVAYSGTGNRVMTSPDGITWTSRVTPVDVSWKGIVYGNNFFVAVADFGPGDRVMTSPDGINWTSYSAPVQNYWQSVAYGNGTFVAVAILGTANRVMTSDGTISDSAFLNVAAGIDLVSENLTLSAGPYLQGDSISLNAQVRNIGALGTGSGFSDNFSYQWNGTGGTWNSLPYISKSPLAPGGVSPDSGAYIPTQTGTLYIQHCVDSLNEIPEGANETPNCTVSDAITVTAPPSVEIFVNNCEISPGFAECTGTTRWEFMNASAPYNIVNARTSATIGTAVSNAIGEPTTLRYGSNQIEGRSNSVLLGFRNVTTGCAGGSIWSPVTSLCELPPVVTISATPDLVRSGHATEVTASVTAANPTNCRIFNATPVTPHTINHPGAPTVTTYGPIDTKSLTSAQIVTVECVDTLTGLIASDETRINVVPTIQEI